MSAERAISIKRNAALAFAAQLTGAAFTAALTIFLARKLGSHGYGLLALALSIAGLVLLPSDFGVSKSVPRFVAEHRVDKRRVEAVLSDGLRLKVLAAAIASVLLAALAGPIAAWYGIPGLAWPLRGVALGLFGHSIMLIGSVFSSVGRNELQLRANFAESAVELTASIILVLTGAGATGAAFGQAIGYLFGAAATIFLLTRLFGAGILPRSLRFGAEARRVAGYAGILLVVDSAYTAFSQIDVLIIGAYLGPSSVGIFSAPIRLINLLAYPGLAVSLAVAPRLARGAVGAPNTEAFQSALRLLIVLQALITTFILGWAGLLVKIGLGAGYRESATVLRALAPFVFLSGLGALLSMSANYLGKARPRVPVAIVTALLNGALDVILVPRIGVVGGAIGTDAAYALYTQAHLLICQRALDLDLRPALWTLLRTTLAGAAMTGVLLLFGEGLDRLWLTALGGVVGVGVFWLVLRLTHEPSLSEAREVLAQLPLARRLPRLQRGGSER